MRVIESETTASADDLLGAIVELTETDETCGRQLMLLVGGRVIRGTLIARASYALALAAAARDVSFTKAIEAHGLRIEKGDRAQQYVHLRDVEVMGGLGGTPLLVPLIRILLDRVDGWMYGAPGTAAR